MVCGAGAAFYTDFDKRNIQIKSGWRHITLRDTGSYDRPNKTMEVSHDDSSSEPNRVRCKCLCEFLEESESNKIHKLSLVSSTMLILV